MSLSRRQLLKIAGGAALGAASGAVRINAGAAGGRAGRGPYLIRASAQTDPPSGELSAIVWGNKNDVDSQKAAVAKYQELFPQVKVNLRQGDCGASFPECKTLIAGKTMPDVFVPGIWNYNAMVNAGALADLTEYIARDEIDLATTYTPKVVEGLRSMKDGNVYGLPMGFNIQSMYFNTGMFDKAGLAYPPADGNYTWDDVRAWAKQMTLDENGNTPDSSDFDPKKTAQWGYSTLAAIPISPGYDPTLLAFGGSTMTLPDRQTCNLENPDSIRAWQFIQDMMWTDRSSVNPQVYQEEAGYLRWVGGKVAMQQGSHEQVLLVAERNKDMKFDMAPLPRDKAGNATVLQFHIWSIYEGSEKKDLAWHLIKWLAAEGSIEGAAGGNAPIMGLIPAYKDLANGPAFLQKPGEPAHLKEAQLDPASWPLCTYPTNYNQKTDEISGQDGFGPALTDIINNKKPAAEALAGINAKIDELMSR